MVQKFEIALITLGFNAGSFEDLQWKRLFEKNSNGFRLARVKNQREKKLELKNEAFYSFLRRQNIHLNHAIYFFFLGGNFNVLKNYKKLHFSTPIYSRLGSWLGRDENLSNLFWTAFFKGTKIKKFNDESEIDQGKFFFFIILQQISL